MKKRSIVRLAALIVAVAVILSSCDLFNMLGGDALNPTERVESFITAVSGTQDIATIKAQFHPTSETYTVIDETWWSGTLFDDFYQPFTFGSLNETDNGTSVTVTTTFTSDTKDAAPTTFVLIEDSLIADNWLIASVTVDAETINSVR